MSDITTPAEMREAAARECDRLGAEFAAEGAPIAKKMMDLAIDRIRALPVAEAAPQAVRIKPLVWQMEKGRQDDCPKWIADVDAKRYEVFKAWWGDQDKWGFVALGEFYHTEDAAKAAAEADHAARILSQIDAVSVAQVRAEALREADYFGSLVLKARTAATKASIKFPQPNYVTLKIAEEAGEVVRGAVHYAEGRMEWAEVEGEIVQLLAMLLRFVTEGDEINGVIPPVAIRAMPVAEPEPLAVNAVMCAAERDAQSRDAVDLTLFRQAIRAEALEAAAKLATSFLVGDPKNGVPLRNPLAHEIAAAIRALMEKPE